MDAREGIPISVYVMEECAELIKELTKQQRRKGSEDAIFSEACGVPATVFMLLRHAGVSEEDVREKILSTCDRALSRYKKTGEM